MGGKYKDSYKDRRLIALNVIYEESCTLFVDWLYSQTIEPVEKHLIPDTSILLGLWVLAAQLQIPRLQNEVLKLIWKRCTRRHSGPSSTPPIFSPSSSSTDGAEILTPTPPLFSPLTGPDDLSISTRMRRAGFFTSKELCAVYNSIHGEGNLLCDFLVKLYLYHTKCFSLDSQTPVDMLLKVSRRHGEIFSPKEVHNQSFCDDFLAPEIATQEDPLPPDDAVSNPPPRPILTGLTHGQEQPQSGPLARAPATPPLAPPPPLTEHHHHFHHQERSAEQPLARQRMIGRIVFSPINSQRSRANGGTERLRSSQAERAV